MRWVLPSRHLSATCYSQGWNFFIITLLLNLEFSILSRLDWEKVPGIVLSISSSGIPGLHLHTQLLCGSLVLNSDSFTCVSGALPVPAIFLFSTVFSLSYLILFASLILYWSLTLTCHKIFCVSLSCTLEQVSLHVSPWPLLLTLYSFL